MNKQSVYDQELPLAIFIHLRHFETIAIGLWWSDLTSSSSLFWLLLSLQQFSISLLFLITFGQLYLFLVLFRQGMTQVVAAVGAL